MIEWTVTICLLIGAIFMLLAAVALLRMPDVFMRLQTNTKASTLGVAFIFLAVAIHFGELHVVARATAVLLFTFLTSPVAAHALARASYLAGQKLWDRSVVDELKDRYDPQTNELQSASSPPDERD